jgi:hypothetical protein
MKWRRRFIDALEPIREPPGTVPLSAGGINPISIESLPKTNSAIQDRRNQMEGNVSMMQSLEFIEFFNLLIKEQAIKPDVVERFVAQFGSA